MVKKITKEDELIVAKLLVEEQIEKDNKRRKYMREYYRQRKKDGFIKCAKDDIVALTQLKIERGDFTVSFN